MPKTRIIETDLTGSRQYAEEATSVYIPGAAAEAVEPVKFESLRKFEEAISDGTYEEDGSAKMARELIKRGISVWYEGFKPSESDSYVTGDFVTSIKRIKAEGPNVVLTFTINGDEYLILDNSVQKVDSEQTPVGEPIDCVNGEASLGTIEVGGEQIEQDIVIDYVHETVGYIVKKVFAGNITIGDEHWKRLEDRRLYDVRFLTTGVYACPTKSMILCAANRGDAVALIDHKIDTKTVADIRAEIEAFSNPGESANADPLSFAAAFTPWFNFEEGGDYFPASFGYLLALAEGLSDYPLWFAFAGPTRGIVPGLHDVNARFSTAEVEQLQARGKDGAVQLDDSEDNVGIAINPIAWDGINGYVIDGNRTMRNNDGVLKASSFLNVRVGITQINKQLYRTASMYRFEQNTDVLWGNFKANVTPLLDRMLTGEGLNAYILKKVKTPAKARLKARLVLVAVEAVEDFDIEIQLADSLDVTEGE